MNALRYQGEHNMNTYGFVHLAIMRNWERILPQLITNMTESDAYIKSTEIYVVILGDTTVQINLPKKCKIAYRTNNLKLFEFVTLNLMYDKCCSENCFVWYVHSHGVSHKDLTEQYVNYIMTTLQSMLSNVDYKLYLLSTFDVHATALLKILDISTKTLINEIIEFNWFWSKSEYIKTLRKIPSSENNRFYAEIWIKRDSMFVNSFLLHTNGLKNMIEERIDNVKYCDTNGD